jgi:hypothetical protein
VLPLKKEVVNLSEKIEYEGLAKLSSANKKILTYQQKKLPLWTLKSPDKKPSSGIKIKTEKKFGLREENCIVCINCGNIITSPECIILVNGHHTHTFSNPEGFIYDIGCFSLAEGCVVYGEPTLDHTWFDGFSWSFSTCSSCLVHLGWYYERKDEIFFGLILDLLAGSTTTH